MSTLEERRAARRKKRQMEEENGLNSDQITADIEERLARRRREREERLKIIAAGVSTINGEDEFERRRRERREERLSEEAPSDTRAGEATEEDTTTSRRSRRRNTEDETDASESSGYRSRRRRGGDEEEDTSSYSAPAEPEPQVDEEEQRRLRREQEEEEDRQRAEAEELRRQQKEEARRRQEEEDRLQAEAEERRQREEDNTIEQEEFEQNEQQSKKPKRLKEEVVDDTINLRIDEDDLNSNKSHKIKTDNHVTKPEINNKDAGKLLPAGKAGKLKSFFEEKKEEKPQNGFQTSITVSKTHTLTRQTEDPSLKQVKEHLKKFETSVLASESAKDSMREKRKNEVRMLAPGNDRLKDIQKRFQGDGRSTESGSSRLGRLSTSDMSLNSSIGGRVNVAGRWQSALEKKQERDLNKKSFRTSTSSLQEDDKSEAQNKRKEKIAKLSAKFNSVDIPNTNGTLSPMSPKDSSSLRRQWSASSDASSDGSSVPVTKRQNSVSSRWQHEQVDSNTTKTRPVSAVSQENKTEQDSNDSQTLSVDLSQNLVKTRTSKQMEEEERIERERLEQEEREREEERLEAERIEQQKLDAENAIREKREREEEAERQELIKRAARRMEEEKKKKKRKGLGGLSPEKKKMLKDDEDHDEDDEKENSISRDDIIKQRLEDRKLIMQKAAEDLKNEAKLKAEEREKYINSHVEPLQTDNKDEQGLQRICKKLFAKLAELEEEVYDWEAKIRKQDCEINDLTLKVNDTKGKFVKPVLRKVNKTESKLEKIHKKDKSDFRDQLKSTGQNKFSLEDEEKKE